MAKIDWSKESQRVRKQYSEMADGELEKLALDPSALTEVARIALRAEMLLRGIEPESGISAVVASEPLEEPGRQPIILRRYRDLPEATIAKSVLDSAGIENFLADDNMVRLDWFYSNLVGNIKLLVRQEDAEAASTLLDESRPEKFEVEGVGVYEQPHCPNCGSMEVSCDALNKAWTFGAMFLTKLPIPVTNSGWECHKCRHRWHDDSPLNTDSPQSPT